jgi:uncharacterized membrane protein
MLEDPSFVISIVLRWGHIMFGIVWLGQLFFFNLINIPFQRDLPDDVKPIVNPKLLLRVHYWFRMGAMYTFIFGWLLFGYKYGHQHLLMQDGAITNRGIWMLFGSLFGSIMWFNVWFIIWPRQRALLGGLISGKPPENAAQLALTAGRTSRFNLFASGPMLFGMIVPNNAAGLTPVAILAAIFLGVGFWFGTIKRSFKVKTEV